MPPVSRKTLDQLGDLLRSLPRPRAKRHAKSLSDALKLVDRLRFRRGPYRRTDHDDQKRGMRTMPCVLCGRQSARFIFVNENADIEIQSIEGGQALEQLGQPRYTYYGWVDDRKGQATTAPRYDTVESARRAILPIHEDCEADLYLTGSPTRLRWRL